MKRGYLNLTLLVLVVVLSAAIWLSPTTDRSRALTPLTPLSPGEVSSIQKSSRQAPPLRLVRVGNRWRMTEPYDLPANEKRVEQLLTVVSAPTLDQFPLPDQRLSEFGLDRPLARLELNGTNLVFGGTEPINHHRYVQSGGELHLLKDIYAHHLMAPAEAFVSPWLFAGQSKITALQTPDWRLVRGADGHWRMTPPVPGLSVQRLTAKIDSWQRAQATRIEAAEAEPGSHTLEIRFEGRPDPLRFSILERPDAVLLVRPEFGLGYLLSDGFELLNAPRGDQP